MTAKGAAIYFSCVAASLALFLLAPGLDLAVSGLFYDPRHGFFLARWLPATALSDSIPWITWSIVGIAAGTGAWLFLVGRPLWRFDRKAILFIVFAVALGPGLVVNTLLKDHWGRARPAQIEAFGGTRQFTPAPLPADQCPSNCSFVSGHAALAFSLVAFAFLLPAGAQRRRGIAAALAFGGLIGADRIIEGRHFLSDIVDAGLIVYGLTALLYWWIVEQDGLATPALIRVYRLAGRGALSAWRATQPMAAEPLGQAALACAATAILVILSIATIDVPVALFFHRQGPDLHAMFATISQLGFGTGYLLTFSLGFVALHWGGGLPRLRPFAAPMRAFSAVPAFLFAAVAVSGISADILKVLFGRARPKLLFAAHLYGFGGLGLQADYWSFPSGHATTIAAIATALWCVWPRHLLFYILVAAIVAGSRVVIGAHFPSDVLAGALIGVLTTRGTAWIFARWGIDLGAARRGRSVSGPAPWPCRRFTRAVAGERDSSGARRAD